MKKLAHDLSCGNIIDGEDRDIASHVNLFIDQLKNNLPLKAVMDACLADPARALNIIREAQAAVEDQLRRANALRAVAERYAECPVSNNTTKLDPISQEASYSGSPH